jgi:polysaccharide export outer membrane protein
MRALITSLVLASVVMITGQAASAMTDGAPGQAPPQAGPADPRQRIAPPAPAPQVPSPQLPANVPPRPAPPAPPPGATYTVGPQDLLSVTVFDEPDLTNKYRVDADGMITFPLVGRVAAAGLTLIDLGDRLRARLTAGYVKNPQVRVEVDQYKSQSVYVIGEVRAPGKITMTGTMSLIEALALAGSPTNAASPELIVVHPHGAGRQGAPTLPSPDSDADADRTRVNIKDLQIGKVGKDIVLADGDTVYVPRAQVFYFSGQVKAPGAYVLDPGMTLLQALSLAGGISDTGSTRGIVAERIVDGKRVRVDLKLTDHIQPGDTIIVRRRFF